MAPRSTDLRRLAIAMAMADATTGATAGKDQVRSPGARNSSDRSAVLQMHLDVLPVEAETSLHGRSEQQFSSVANAALSSLHLAEQLLNSVAYLHNTHT
jgi:hypothetical protein